MTLSRQVVDAGLGVLMIADAGQPRGGPVSGHASHEAGLDVDIWLRLLPDHAMSASERAAPEEVSMLTEDGTTVDLEPLDARTYRALSTGRNLPKDGADLRPPADQSPSVPHRQRRPILAWDRSALVRARCAHAYPADLPARQHDLCQSGTGPTGRRRVWRRVGLVAVGRALPAAPPQTGPAPPPPPLPYQCAGVLNR